MGSLREDEDEERLERAEKIQRFVMLDQSLRTHDHVILFLEVGRNVVSFCYGRNFLMPFQVDRPPLIHVS